MAAEFIRTISQKVGNFTDGLTATRWEAKLYAQELAKYNRTFTSFQKALAPFELIARILSYHEQLLLLDDTESRCGFPGPYGYQRAYFGLDIGNIGGGLDITGTEDILWNTHGTYPPRRCLDKYVVHLDGQTGEAKSIFVGHKTDSQLRPDAIYEMPRTLEVYPKISAPEQTEALKRVIFLLGVAQKEIHNNE